MSYIH